MTTLFRAPLAEHYRPRTWADVVGQDKTVARIKALQERSGLAGRALFLSGQSGTGKTSFGRLIASEVASEWDVEELDAGALSVASLREIERSLSVRVMGEKGGRAVIINEAHALCKDVIRQLLVSLERISGHVVWCSLRLPKEPIHFLKIATTQVPCCRAVCALTCPGATWRARSLNEQRPSPKPKGWQANRALREASPGMPQ